MSWHAYYDPDDEPRRDPPDLDPDDLKALAEQDDERAQVLTAADRNPSMTSLR